MEGFRVRDVFASFEFMLLVVIISLVIVSISEIVARQQFLTLVSTQVTDIQSELVEAGIGTELTKRIDVLRQQASVLKRIRAEAESLIAIGANRREHTLQHLRDLKGQSEELARQALFADVEAGPQSSSERDSTIESKLGFYSFFIQPFAILNSDILLAIVVIGCGSIGAVVAGIRAENGFAIKPFTLGLAAGFIAFLAIKGGRYLFLIGAENSSLAFNPYSSAFVGILVGMFTEKAYELLSELVDELIARIKSNGSA